ncbi:BPSL0761 family protein [Pseudomonas sp. UMAB-40]|uniref:BPSL0761 family protein n=1 Tax=Pseudomonas sp. UMAB-40 TaxID=1365407 RepID=UPI0027D89622|nr:BPSL0761 family protein [Pseudomonas sp. UMAB-40]
MPSERTRSLIQIRDFLVELPSDEAVSETLRTQARRLLRHYQSSTEILLAGKLVERRTGRLASPFLSSIIE